MRVTRLLTNANPLLRAESAALLGLGLLLFWEVGGNWLALLALGLAPDLSMLGYIGGNRVGAVVYNVAHLYIGATLLATLGIVASNSSLVALSLIWFTHINLDRMLGYGLKRPTSFKDTHLGRIGRTSTAEP